MDELRPTGEEVPLMAADQEPMRLHEKIGSFEGNGFSGEVCMSLRGTLFVRIQREGGPRRHYEVGALAVVEAAQRAYEAEHPGPKVEDG